MSDNSRDLKQGHEKEEEELDKAAGEYITLKTVTDDGAEIYFKIKRSCILAKLMDAHCLKTGVKDDQVCFLYEGAALSRSSTPKDMSMIEEDTIRVVSVSVGGNNHQGQEPEDSPKTTSTTLCGEEDNAAAAAAGERLQPEAKVADESIALKTVDDDGAEVFFKIKRSTILAKLMHAYCQKKGSADDQLHFSYKGTALDPSLTPMDLGMSNGDIIDVTPTASFLENTKPSTTTGAGANNKLVFQCIGVSTDPNYIRQFGAKVSRVPIEVDAQTAMGKGKGEQVGATVKNLAEAAHRHFHLPDTKKVHCWFYPPNYDDSVPFSTKRAPKWFPLKTKLIPATGPHLTRALVFCNVVDVSHPIPTDQADQQLLHIMKFDGKTKAISSLGAQESATDAWNRMVKFTQEETTEKSLMLHRKEGVQLVMPVVSLDDIEKGHQLLIGDHAHFIEMSVGLQELVYGGKVAPAIKRAPKPRSLSVVDLFPGHEEMLIKPKTPLGWFMGPDDVRHVYGPWIPLTEGLLFSFMCKGFGQNVHLVNAMANLINESSDMDTVSSKFKREVAQGWETQTILMKTQRTLSDMIIEGGGDQERMFDIFHNIPPLNEVILHGLLTIRRLFNAGFVSLGCICQLYTFALGGGTDSEAPIFGTGQLPLEFLAALTTALNAAKSSNSLVQMNHMNLPTAALARRLFENLLQGLEEEKEISQRSKKGIHHNPPATGAPMVHGWKHSKTTARLQLLCAIFEGDNELAGKEDIATQEPLAGVVSLFEHAYAPVAGLAMRLCGAFANCDDDAMDLLLAGGFLPAVHKLLSLRAEPYAKQAIIKEGLWTLYNTFASAPKHAEAALEAEVDLVGLRYLSNVEAEEDSFKPTAIVRNEAIHLAIILTSKNLLRNECVFKLCQDIAALLVDCNWTTNQSHWKNIFDLTATFCVFLRREIRSSCPKLFADVCRWWSAQELVAALEKHHKQRPGNKDLLRVTKFFEENSIPAEDGQ